MRCWGIDQPVSTLQAQLVKLTNAVCGVTDTDGSADGCIGNRDMRLRQSLRFDQLNGTTSAFILSNEHQVGPLPPVRSTYPQARPRSSSSKASSFPRLLASSFSRAC